MPLQALAAGTATVTVQAAGLSASMTLTVLAAGTVIPDGTTLRSLGGGSGVAPPRGDVLRATYVEPAPGTTPAELFFVERESFQKLGPLSTPLPASTVIRATTLDGREVWRYAAGDYAVRHAAADGYGGVVLVTGRNWGWDSLGRDAIRRLDGVTGATTWEYWTPSGQFSEAAIHPNGTVYVVETTEFKTELLAIDGQTSAVGHYDLGAGRVHRIDNGQETLNAAYPVNATHPIIREDGSVAVVSYTFEAYAHRTCYTSINECHPRDRQSGDAPNTHELRLHTLAEGAGALTTQPIAHDLDPATLPFSYGDLDHLLPDGAGGLLFSVPGAVYRVPPELTLSAPVVLQVQPNELPDRAEFVLGEDAAYAVVQQGAAAAVTAFAPSSMTLQSVTPVAPGAEYVKPSVALDEGGVFIGSQAHEAPIAGGIWAEWGAAPSVFLAQGVDPFSGWRVPRGDIRGANRYPAGFVTMDRAAVDGLDFIYPVVRFTGVEWGALICRSGVGTGVRYRWSRFVTEYNPDRVSVLTLAQCRDGETAVGDIHGHRQEDGGTEPSGLTAGTPIPNDRTTAESRPDLRFYLKGPTENWQTSPGPDNHIIKYYFDSENVGCNLHEWNGSEFVELPPHVDWAYRCVP